MNKILELFNLKATKKSPTSDKDKSSSAKKSEKKDPNRKKNKRSKSPRRPKSTCDTVSTRSEHSISTGLTPNEQIIVDYIATVNAHSSVEDMVQFYAKQDINVKFDDAPPLTALALQTEIHNLCQSFKDFRFNYESIKETRPGEVMVDNLCVTGTHNGQPYALGPLPPVEAAGKHVVLDPECLYFTLDKDGKIEKEECVALGNLTGPPGFYILIGGVIPSGPPPS